NFNKQKDNRDKKWWIEYNRMVMTRAKGKGEEAQYSRRHAGFAAARHHSSCRYPRSRWRHPASCDPFRDVPFLEKALCRWWLPGAGLSKGLGEDLASARN